MGKIIYIMGKSSSGKDTIYRELLAHNDWQLKTLVPYTTRPIRVGEVDGREYHFVSEEEFIALEEAGKVIEARSYHTCHGLWRYFTVNEDIDLINHNYIIIGTLESFIKTRKYFQEQGKVIVPIYIELDDGERLFRALQRERAQEHPKYRELCRRFLADSEDFSEEKIQDAKITIRFMNNQLEQCLLDIKEYLKEVM